ncbi:exodeoxyribonuclease-3 [Sinobacterium caligoides]|uniref:Exodeoxyribonuclease-3 n=1 Tax=Sinobacterium caligoides TaxID=933926 RepID=A0A3N2DXN8_9GAMM|nr:exodeoxyribonuclease III [Sinobacterium caligoides]ROS04630.1 exodeoxyribonuclease-3 [Sinobacterium caligoides]
MRIISVNTNGIRAAAKKGFFDWMLAQQADVVCIQETKAQEEQLGDDVFKPEGYHRFFFDAEKKGYSGTAIYSKSEPLSVVKGLGWDPCDSEGRYIIAEYANTYVASLYLPSGTAGDVRQDVKYDFMAKFMQHLEQLQKRDKEVIICGDWNIAHTVADIKNATGNKKNSGFLPEERTWMDGLFGDAGWVDAFRCIEQEPHTYTFWSTRGQAWANNTGWRIDYQVVTPAIAERVLSSSVYKEQRFSDHAPLSIDYSGEL